MAHERMSKEAAQRLLVAYEKTGNGDSRHADAFREVIALHEELAELRIENERMCEREKNVAELLGLDGIVQYRVEWPFAVRRVREMERLAERDACIRIVRTQLMAISDPPTEARVRAAIERAFNRRSS